MILRTSPRRKFGQVIYNPGTQQWFVIRRKCSKSLLTRRRTRKTRTPRLHGAEETRKLEVLSPFLTPREPQRESIATFTTPRSRVDDRTDNIYDRRV